MGANTKIEWADHTFNPWWGCTKISVGDKGACEFCYAEPLAHRFGVGWGNAPRKKAGPKHLALPAQWQRAALKSGTRPFVFCASMADIFDNQVDPAWRREAFDIMRTNHRLVFLLLTKRPSMIEKLATEAGGLPHNAAIGCSAVTKKEAARDISHLLHAKAALRSLFAFVSLEPLMERVYLSHLDCDGGGGEADGFYQINALTGRNTDMGRPCRDVPKLDWVITGGESGPKARPSHPDWFRALRDECAAARTPFLFKQWGEWHPSDAHPPGEQCPPTPEALHVDGRREFRPAEQFQLIATPGNGWAGLCKIGKQAAGRLLDGVEHNGFPAGFEREKAAA